MPKTLKELAAEALAVQDACNLSGVVHGFSRAVTALRECLPNAGTDAINTHPIVRLWVDKLCHLSGMSQDYDKASTAWNQCERLANELPATAPVGQASKADPLGDIFFLPNG